MVKVVFVVFIDGQPEILNPIFLLVCFYKKIVFKNQSCHTNLHNGTKRPYSFIVDFQIEVIVKNLVRIRRSDPNKRKGKGNEKRKRKGNGKFKSKVEKSSFVRHMFVRWYSEKAKFETSLQSL
jgi:hypothetical protein